MATGSRWWWCVLGAGGQPLDLQGGLFPLPRCKPEEGNGRKKDGSGELGSLRKIIVVVINIIIIVGFGSVRATL